jgi:DNA-binding NarL/FixJ family response regulator
MTTPRIRVLCVDDHRIVLQGIALIIRREPDLEVIATTTTAREAIACFEQYRPDVTLMDLQLGAVSGLDAIRAIRRNAPAAKIIVLTMYQGDEDIYRALEAGAATYLLKDALSDDLVRIIREVNDGKHPITPDVEERLARRHSAGILTTREVQVIELIAKGMRNKEVASELGISEETAHVHIKNIFAKLSVNDRTAAVHVAIRRGIIHIF